MGQVNLGIQWKGTDACLDLHCECGESSHFDGYFAYAIQCLACERMYDLAQTIEVLPFSGKYTVVVAENPDKN